MKPPILCRILLVDDEPEFADVMRQKLASAGYIVDTVHSAHDGWETILAGPPDLVILKAMLPDLDGLALCRALRQEGQQIPILMLTADDTISDRFAGLNAGADDCQTNAFAVEELLARVRALLRRCGNQETEVLTFANLKLDTRLRKARCGEQLLQLNPKEYDLLAFFLRHPGQVLTRRDIFTQVWGYDYEATSNVLAVYIRRLRHKLGEPGLIKTVHSLGYILRKPTGDR